MSELQKQQNATISRIKRIAQILMLFGIGLLVGVGLAAKNLDEVHRVLVGFAASISTTGAVLWGIYGRGTKMLIEQKDAEADSYREVSEAQAKQIVFLLGEQKRTNDEITELKTEFSKLRSDNLDMRRQNEVLLKENESCKIENDQLREENSQLRARVGELENDLHELRTSVEELKTRQ